MDKSAAQEHVVGSVDKSAIKISADRAGHGELNANGADSNTVF